VVRQDLIREALVFVRPVGESMRDILSDGKIHTINEIAELAGVSLDTVRRNLRTLPNIRMGRVKVGRFYATGIQLVRD
jgi:hypothetical protein